MDLKVFIIWFLTISLWGVSSILEKIGLRNISPLVGLFIRTFFSLMGLSIAVFLLEKEKIFTLQSKEILILCGSGILGGFLGMLGYFTLLKTKEASLVVPLTASYPLVSTILAVLLLKEPLTLYKLLGTLLVILGLVLLFKSSS